MKSFFTILLISFPLWSYSQLSDIVAAEYFFDADPGIGAATALPAFSANSNLDVTFLAASSGLAEGMHILGIRVQDNTAIWSIPLFLPVYVLANNPTLSAAEYFFDTDPGVGNATPISITASATIDVTFAANSAALGVGMHLLAVRTRDANGDWGMPAYTPFYIDQSRTITKLEYFFDNDPGSGNGTAIVVSPATDILDQIYSMNSSALPIGSHTLQVRVAGQNNFWSIPEFFNFSVTAAPPPTITSFTPTSGPIGTSVTITGTNFSTTPANNIVYFGAVKAVVTAATATQLSVTVPIGTTFKPITIMVNGLTAQASKPFVVTFAGGSALDNCSFAPPLAVAPVSDSYTPTLCDLDGDGKIDLLIPELSNNQLAIFRNTSVTGVPSFAANIPLTGLTQAIATATGDLDGDGKPDIAVANYSNGQLSVYKNLSTPGTISVAPRVIYTIPAFTDEVSIADIDGDGKLDLLITASIQGLIVMRNQGVTGVIDASTFAAGVTFATGPNAYPVALGDLDGDGKLDAVVPSANTYTLSLLRNTSTPGTVSFATPVTLTTETGTPTAGYGTGYVSLGDIDGDAKTDIVAVSNTITKLSLFRNISTPGSLVFDPRFDIATTGIGLVPPLSDLNGDGKLDLVADNGPLQMLVFENTATAGEINAASFKVPVVLTRASSYIPQLGDVDGDGRNDVISTSTNVQVFRNLVGTISPPTITSFSPGIGPNGSTVVINGTNFSTPFGVNVEFNGVSAPLIDTTPGTITVGVPVGATTGPLSVTIGCNTVVSASNFIVGTPATITITTQPSDAFACVGDITTFTTAATGTTNITYQWQYSPDGNSFTDIVNNINYSGATTTTLSVNTSGSFGEGRYRCRINGDFAIEVISNDEGLFINPAVSKPAIVSSLPLVGNTITICSSSVLTLSAPSGFNSYLWSDGSTTQQITVTSSGSYSVTVGSAAGCISPVSDLILITIIPAPCGNQPPVINSTIATTIIGGITSINLLDLISDVDNNLVSSSLIVVQQPVSGAPATISNGILEIDYDGITFAGRDQLTIQVCDVFGECVQQILEIDVIGDIEIYNALSPNGDNQNEIFLIQYIDLLPETENNTVTIFNRWGSKVFEVSNYNNTTNVFKGLNNNGNELPSGTYFYKIKFHSPQTTFRETEGYLVLKR